MTEAKRNRITRKIDKLKKILRDEKSMNGAYHDGNGIRYSIAELYFELKDYKKTNRYLNWFDKNFPDDMKYSYYQLGVAVTKYELGKLKEAKKATINLNRHNTYLIDLLTRRTVEDLDKYEWTESESLLWIQEHLTEHLELVTDNYLVWLQGFRNDELYKKWFNKLIAIKKLLKDLGISKERNRLLIADQQCIDDWISAI